jgi:hypothetical protein
MSTPILGVGAGTWSTGYVFVTHAASRWHIIADLRHECTLRMVDDAAAALGGTAATGVGKHAVAEAGGDIPYRVSPTLHIAIDADMDREFGLGNDEVSLSQPAGRLG